MIAVVIMMLLTVTDVILRRLFSSPILGVMEYSQMIMVVILLAAASTAMDDGHIKVDLIVSRLPKKAQEIISLITLTLTFITSLLMATSVLKAGLEAVHDHLTFLTIKFSQAPFIFLYSLGLFILAVSVACLFAETIRRLRKHE
jgi:TRAP-type C4-dicarboxylate transport system permease small subunit